MIYDCFTFYKELVLLEVRLKSLSPYVDKFVISESPYSHSGRKKPLYYKENKALFREYNDKIIHITHNGPRTNNRWVNISAQRNALIYGLKFAKEQDLIIVSDSDEILRPEAIQQAKELSFGRIGTRTYYYKFNCQMKREGLSGDYHKGVGFSKFKYLLTTQLLRKQTGGSVIEDGGWHFSYLQTSEDIAEKLIDSCHTEYETEYFTDTNRIQGCIDNNTDLFNRVGYELSVVPLDAPPCVMENREKHREYIREEENGNIMQHSSTATGS